MNVKPRQDRLTVLKLLLEGNSLRSVARLTGFERNTCSRIVVEFGHRCGRFLNREIRDLTIRHVQVDELFTFVDKHRWNVDKADPLAERKGEIAVYVALDSDTKLVPVHRVGKLCQQSTYQFIYDLRGRLKMPRPQSPDEYPDGFAVGKIQPVIQISSDGFSGYERPIKSLFGPFADYGQIVKKIVKKKGERRQWLIRRRIVEGKITEEDISTSLVERINLTIRTFMRPMARKSLGFAKKLENLQAAANAFFAHYNYCWKHHKIKTSPAYAAGLAPRRFSLEELYDLVHENTIPLWEDFDESSGESP